MTLLTRRYRFSASHRLHVPDLSDAENRELFGKCNNPFGHGHDYVLSVTLAGHPDEQTGLIIRTDLLDRLVEENVLQLFAHRNLNLDLPQFAERVPTTENVALVIAELLQTAWDSFPDKQSARLAKIHVQETDRNGFEVNLDTRQPEVARMRRQENTTVNG